MTEKLSSFNDLNKKAKNKSTIFILLSLVTVLILGTVTGFFENWASLILPITIFILLFICNIPVAVGMASSAVSYFVVSGIDISIVSDKMLDTLYTSYSLIAVPLFIFTAQVMNNGEVTERIFKFATALVGKSRGAMAQVNIITSLIFSGMTGSAIADASGIGGMEIEAMKKDGYDAEFSCALTAASATVGPIFPPSIPMVMYSMLSGASVGSLFIAGMVPGVLISIFLMIYVAFVSNKRNYPRGEKFAFDDFIKFTVSAIPALITPVILLGSIYTGIVTTTEAGAIAALYALIVSIVIYKSISIKVIKHILIETVKQTGVVALMVASASAFSYIVAVEGIPQLIAESIMNLTQNKYVFLCIVNIIMLILGMVLDTSVIQLVFLPIILPIVNMLGIDLVHFGVVATLNMMIGLSTPPFGMLLFITSGISGTNLKGIIKEMMPMLLVMALVLLLVTFIPELTLFLPNMMGM